MLRPDIVAIIEAIELITCQLPAIHYRFSRDTETELANAQTRARESSARLVKYVKDIFVEKGPCPPVKQCVVPDPTCCDGRPYDHVKQVCCQRRLYDREDDVDCCAVDSIYRVNPPYNGIKEICCQGVVQERPNNAECCAENVKRQFCCQGNLYNRHPDVICPGCCGGLYANYT
ncbi:hypothetical protein LSAT2_008406 [Lamellibrachia satsuma]|nr:hypothetical protein LSAT2_008406 [Lamellibrachia satsuma]